MELGPIKGTILSHRTKMLGDKLVVALQCETEEGEQCFANVFITPKSAGMARRALKTCGFDIDAQPLSVLDENPTLLSGRKVPLLVDEWNGRMTISIDLDARAEKAVLDKATAAMRAVKKDKESEPEPSGPGEPVEDYGDIPFGLLFGVFLAGMSGLGMM